MNNKMWKKDFVWYVYGLRGAIFANACDELLEELYEKARRLGFRWNRKTVKTCCACDATIGQNEVWHKWGLCVKCAWKALDAVGLSERR